MEILDDFEFLDSVTALAVSDIEFLQRYGHLLSEEDFKPRTGQQNGRDRSAIAVRALRHWRKHREPIAPVLLSEMREHGKHANFGESRIKELLAYTTRILKKKNTSPDSIAERLRSWKLQTVIDSKLSEIAEEQLSGKLTAARFLALAHETVQAEARLSLTTPSFFDSQAIDERFDSRASRKNRKFLPLMIEPFDLESRAIARGHLGLLLAPYKRGKSLMLLHIALAYALQHLRVLYFTLEDPLEEVQDRIDASISGVPLQELADRPKLVKKRIERFAKFVPQRIKVIDRVEEGASVSQIEQVVLSEAASGFKADAVIIDYDDEIVPPQKRNDRRMEFADIYRELRRMAARQGLYTWTACQTQRNTRDTVKLSGDQIAEDISKVRKVALAVGIGKGEPEWEAIAGHEALHLYIAAHKFGRQDIGVNIVSDKACARIFDPQRTREVQKQVLMRGPEE